MDVDIKDSLEDLGYSGPLSDDNALKKAVDEGVKSTDFTQLVAWLSTELQTLCEFESCVNAIIDDEDTTSFLVEVSSLLKEMQCPYKSLLEGPISDRFAENENRIILLDYLCSELQAARIVKHKSQGKRKFLDIEMDASSTATDLTNLIHELDLDNDVKENPIELLSEAEKKVAEHISSGSEVLPGSLLSEELSESQWVSILEFQKEMHEDYQTRREMLLTRLDVTIQSFKWGEGSKGREDQIAKAFVHRRKELKPSPNVDISDLLAAREDLLIIEKTSSAEQIKNTKSSINRVIIPAVPDRGGRPEEQRPPMEMPNFHKRMPGKDSGWACGVVDDAGHGKRLKYSGGGRGHYRGGGGGGGKKGGKGKGSWNK